jgi:hypothetical protein
MERIVKVRDGGGIAIITPHEIYGENDKFVPITQEVLTKYKGTAIVKTADIPKDGALRNAWVFENGKVTVSLPKARRIVMDIENKRFEKQSEMLSTLPSLTDGFNASKTALLASINSMDVAGLETYMKRITNG